MHFVNSPSVGSIIRLCLQIHLFLTARVFATSNFAIDKRISYFYCKTFFSLGWYYKFISPSSIT